MEWSEGHDGRSLGMYKARRAVVLDQLLNGRWLLVMMEMEPKLRRAILSRDNKTFRCEALLSSITRECEA